MTFSVVVKEVKWCVRDLRRRNIGRIFLTSGKYDSHNVRDFRLCKQIVQEKSGKDHTVVSPAKGHKTIDDHGIRASDTQGKAEKAETVHPGEEKA